MRGVVVLRRQRRHTHARGIWLLSIAGCPGLQVNGWRTVSHQCHPLIHHRASRIEREQRPSERKRDREKAAFVPPVTEPSAPPRAPPAPPLRALPIALFPLAHLVLVHLCPPLLLGTACHEVLGGRLGGGAVSPYREAADRARRRRRRHRRRRGHRGRRVCLDHRRDVPRCGSHRRPRRSPRPCPLRHHHHRRPRREARTRPCDAYARRAPPPHGGQRRQRRRRCCPRRAVGVGERPPRGGWGRQPRQGGRRQGIHPPRVHVPATRRDCASGGRGSRGGGRRGGGERPAAGEWPPDAGCGGAQSHSTAQHGRGGMGSARILNRSRKEEGEGGDVGGRGGQQEGHGSEQRRRACVSTRDGDDNAPLLVVPPLIEVGTWADPVSP